MPAPLVERLFRVDTPYARREREIDIHYDMELMAENTSDLVDCQKHLIGAQSEAARANLQAIKQLHAGQVETSGLLDAICQGIDRLHSSSIRATDETRYQSDVFEQGLSLIAEELIRNQHILADIATTLAEPYETQVRELLREAQAALRAGMANSGKERDADYSDALRLLTEVLANPIGSRNYTAWFQTGWLKWQALNEIGEAEEAFKNAVRLSKTHGNLYYVDSLRYLAHMQYLAQKYQDAHVTIQRAVEFVPGDHDSLYDAARYASRLDLKEEAAKLLDICIGLRPQTIVVMFSEEDFLSMQEELVSILRVRTEQAQAHATAALEDCNRSIETASATLREARTDPLTHRVVRRADELSLNDVTELVETLAGRLPGADYLTVLGITRLASEERRHAIERVSTELGEIIGRRERSVAELRRQIQQASADQDRCIRSMDSDARSRRSAICSEEDSQGERLMLNSVIPALVGVPSFIVVFAAMYSGHSHMNPLLQFLILITIPGVLALAVRAYAQIGASNARRRRIAAVERESADQIAVIRADGEKQLGILKDQVSELEASLSWVKQATSTLGDES